ncbi:MAG: efflux RND transporter periplasmic adaptor subunit [Terriglobales bacterium]
MAGTQTAGPLPPAPKPARQQRHWLRALIIALLIAGCVVAVRAGWRAWQQSAAPAATIPTFRVEPGTVQVIAYAKGTLQGGQADRLTAPSIGGDQPRISYLLPAGAEVKPGDIVVRFDTGQEEFKLAQAENAAAQAAVNVAGAEDQAHAQSIEDAYSLLHARDQVQLAKITVRENPMLPALDAKNNLLALQSAEAELQQWQQDIAQQRASGQGLIAIQQTAAEKANADAADARRYIASMTLRAARAGYVALEANSDGAQELYQGALIEPFHVGDPVSPGTVVAEIPDLTQLRMQARLSQAGSAYVTQGQPAHVQITGLPGGVFSSHVLRVSGLQTAVFSNAQSQTCVLTIEGSDARLRPGMEATAQIVLGSMQHVLWVPVEALFQQNGEPMVYVRRGGSFSPQLVKVLRQGAIRIAISGIPAGTIVALSNPAGAPAAEALP